MRQGALGQVTGVTRHLACELALPGFKGNEGVVTIQDFRRLGILGLTVIVAVGLLAIAVGSKAAAAGTPPTYTWPEAAQNSSLTGVSADPSLNTSDAANLGVRWMTNVGSEVLSSPIVAYNSTLGETLVYVATTAGLITAYDQATGLPVWSVDMGGYITSTPLAEGNDRGWLLRTVAGSTSSMRPGDHPVLGLVPLADAAVFVADPCHARRKANPLYRRNRHGKADG